MPLGAATVVQVLHGVFYVLLQLLGIAAITVSFVASFIVVVIPPLSNLYGHVKHYKVALAFNHGCRRVGTHPCPPVVGLMN